MACEMEGVHEQLRTAMLARMRAVTSSRVAAGVGSSVAE
jgi:hypothetical protein